MTRQIDIKSMRKLSTVSFLAALAVIVVTVDAHGGAILDAQSRRISFQARLTDNQGNPLPGATVNLSFRIYTTLDGPIEGPILMNNVPMSSGMVDVMIPVSSASFDGFGRKLGVSVNGGAELSPKIEFGTVPYAIRVDRVTSLELDDAIDLGSASANGSLNIFKSGLAAPPITLDGFSGVVRATNGYQIWSNTLNSTLGNFTLQSSGAILQTYDETAATTLRLGSASTVGGFIEVYRGTGGTSVFIDGDEGAGNGLVDVRNSAQTSTVKLEGISGQVSTFDSAGVKSTSLGNSVNGGVLSLYTGVGPTDGAQLYGDLTDHGGALLLNDHSGDLRASLDADTGAGAALYLQNSASVPTANLTAGTVSAALDLKNGASSGITLDADNGDGGAYFAMYSGGSLRFGIDANDGTGGGALMNMRNSLGNITLALDADSSDDGVISIDDGAGNASIRLHSDSFQGAGEISMYANDGTTETIEIIGAETATSGGQMILRKADGTATIVLDAEFGTEGGRITTQVLEITGGSDLSEQFDITGATTIEPGMVVSIDAQKTGNLVVSNKAFDRTVAGIVSGAGGVKPGFLMGQRGTVADGKHPVALTGRVFCYCDATNGAIEPGDLLTTSATPGHAMKVTDPTKAGGAIIGKAMGSLKKGRGLVLVLVSLQ